MARHAYAPGVDTAGQQAAQVPGSTGRAHRGERGPAGLLRCAEQADRLQHQAEVGHALAEQGAHHGRGALHAARGERGRGRVEAVRRREAPAPLPEQHAVEIGDDLHLAEQQIVGAAQFRRGRAGGEGRVFVVKDQRQAAVGNEGGGRDDVAVGGEELAERTPHAVAAGEAVGEQNQRKAALRGSGVLPRAARCIENPPADVVERGLPGRVVGIGQHPAIAQMDELRQHDLGSGPELPRHVTRLKIEIVVIRGPPAGRGKEGARAGLPVPAGVARRGIPHLKYDRPRLPRGFYPPQQGAILRPAVNTVPGVEALAVVHREAGRHAYGVVAVGGARRQRRQFGRGHSAVMRRQATQREQHPGTETRRSSGVFHLDFSGGFDAMGNPHPSPLPEGEGKEGAEWQRP